MKRLPITYTDADREYFATYVSSRATCRPAECNSGPNCWVTVGPPGFTVNRPIHPATKGAFCRECSGSLFLGAFRARKTPDAEARRFQAYRDANERWPLPISGRDE